MPRLRAQRMQEAWPDGSMGVTVGDSSLVGEVDTLPLVRPAVLEVVNTSFVAAVYTDVELE